MPKVLKGGVIFLDAPDLEDVFTPEDFSTEHELIIETASGFVERSVMPKLDELEAKKEELSTEMLREIGELGLLAADIPEEYGGIEVDKIASVIIAEEMGRTGSFSITQGGQVGIGSLPIVFFGNDAQKKKYLPDIASADKIAAYALTEPGAGSDAMALGTKATLSSDSKSYLLNGAKQFISNAGFADVFIVFARVEDKLSVFIVENGTEGFSFGEEEKKMGLKGSSTRALFLDDAVVPAENLLYEIGKGHVVAFNILNLGRLKVAANALGAAKYALELSATYANERRQFKSPIAKFGMIKEKLAEMAVRIYASESMIYRTSGLINEKLHSLDTGGPDGGQVAAQGIEEYAIECSMNKVFGSEMLDYVVDEGVQIHGGYGYIAEYPIERLYRDARILRIFEGTNEINRTLIPTMMLRKAAKGGLPLQESIAAVKERLTKGIPDRLNTGDLVDAAKDIFLFSLGEAMEKLGDGLRKEQEVLARIADIAMGTFAMESAWLRAQKALQQKNDSAAARKMKMADAFAYGTIEKLGLTALQVLTAVAKDKELLRLREDLGKLKQYVPIDTIALNRDIASDISEAGKYVA